MKIDVNYHDHLTKVILPQDEVILRTKFEDNIGPNAPAIVNKDGKFLADFAQAVYVEIVKNRAKVGPRVGCSSSVADEIKSNESERKRVALRVAMAKREPKRAKRSLGSVVLD